jgi:hypothetical protein
MLAITKPIDRMLHVVIRTAMVKLKSGMSPSDRIEFLARSSVSASVAAVSRSFTITCAVRIVRDLSGVGAQSLENAAFAVDGHDRDQRHNCVDGDQNRNEHWDTDLKKAVAAA